MSFDALQEKIIACKNPTVVGLDPKPEYVPPHIRKACYEQYGETLEGAAEALYQRLLPEAECVSPAQLGAVASTLPRGGADRVLECGGNAETFEMAWKYARPNAVVVIAAMYEQPQVLPLPDMYGKNLIFKTGGVDGCDCAEILKLIASGKIDASPVITHTFALKDIAAAYELFESGADGVMKIAVRP